MKTLLRWLYFSGYLAMLTKLNTGPFNQNSKLTIM